MVHWNGSNFEKLPSLEVITQTHDGIREISYDTLLQLVKDRITQKQDLDGPLWYDSFNTTPLLKSCGQGDQYIQITQLLLSHNANPNKADSQGTTPLHKAMGGFQSETVKTLLEKGAQPNIKNSTGMTPLNTMCWNFYDTLDLLQAERRVTIVTELLNAHADPTIKYSWGSTCLHQLLSECGIYGTHHFSEEKGFIWLSQRKKLIKLIIDAGGLLTTKNMKGKTTLEAFRNYYNAIDKNDHIELSQCALGCARSKLVATILSPLKSPKFTLFKILPKELVKMIVFMVYPSRKKKTAAT